MTVAIVVPLKDFERVLRKNTQKLRHKLASAIKKTSRQAVRAIQKNVPRAFEEIADGIDYDFLGAVPRTISTAPHAAPVEVGSRPHTPPIEPLIAWVKLRGMQGLTKTGRIKKSLIRQNPAKIGTTTAWHAIVTAAQLKKMERGPKNGRFLPVDAAERIARSIQHAISIGGTKPHWYVRKSLPEIRNILGANIAEALEAATNAAEP